MKKVLLIIMCLMAVLSLARCGQQSQKTEPETRPQALAIVLGAHGNSQGLNLNNSMVQNTVTNAVKSNGFVSVISVDGNPELLVANLYTVPEQYANANKTRLEMDAMMKANDLLSELETVRANDPESDVLKSLELAVRSLSDQKEMERVILVIDTGLSTSGVMDFKGNLIMAEPDDLAEQLAQRSAIPDFEDITVIWLQMGDTAAPQEELTASQRERLTAIWKAIVEKTGGTFICSEAPANPTSPEEKFPEMSTVSLPEELPIAFDSSFNQGELPFASGPVYLSEEQVKFKGDSDQYFDEAQAVTVLTPIAEAMLAHPDTKLLLIGTTAGDEISDNNITLSKARAETVSRTLISLGVSPDNLTTIGLGSEDPWHIYGVGMDADDPLAAANRKVVLLNAESEEAIALLNR